MMDDELFDNGIDGTAWEESDVLSDEYYDRECFDVHMSNGLEVQGWPTYGNYTITTNTFHVYWYPGSNTLRIYDANIKTLLLTLKNQDLYFFGNKINQNEKLFDDDGKYNIEFYSSEQINRKIQRYIDLRAFL